MIFRLTGFVKDVFIMEDIASESMSIIEYNCSSFGEFKEVLRLVNALYLDIFQHGVDEEVLEMLQLIVQELNNLAYFEIRRDFQLHPSGKEYILDLMQKMDEFEYKKLSCFDIGSGFCVGDVSVLTSSVFDRIEDAFCTSGDRLRDIKSCYANAYAVYDDSSGECRLLSHKNENKLISLVDKANHRFYFAEIKKVLEMAKGLNVDACSIEGFYNFSVTASGVYKEIHHLMKANLNLLLYFLNSSSFRENKLICYDQMEISNRLYRIQDSLPHIKSYARYCYELDINNK